MTVASVGVIAVAESDPNVVYVGTGSDGLRSNVSTGRGVYKSIDAGKTWSFVGLYNAGNIGGLRIHPTDPNTAWVAAIVTHTALVEVNSATTKGAAPSPDRATGSISRAVPTRTAAAKAATTTCAGWRSQGPSRRRTAARSGAVTGRD